MNLFLYTNIFVFTEKLKIANSDRIFNCIIIINSNICCIIISITKKFGQVNKNKNEITIYLERNIQL